MSSKNLKVYKITFFTQIRVLHLKVKFPCKLKVVWKRSNQQAQSKLVPLQNYEAKFNETLSLNVKMYFDTNISKFVEKKCLYNFLIITDKGEKSAGNVTYDLAEFLNQRSYQIQQDFNLSKCPVENTKVNMKIYYQESNDSGYDTMSKMSVADHNILDSSALSARQIDNLEKNNSQTESLLTQHSSKDKQKVQEQYQQLNQSAIEQKNYVEGDNIQSVMNITDKISSFVDKISTSLKFQIENLRRQKKTIQEQLTAANIQNQKLAENIQEFHKNQQTSKTEIANLRDKLEHSEKSNKQELDSLRDKLKQEQHLRQQLQNNIQQKGESQATYITQLKNSFVNSENKMKQQVSQLKNELMEEKKLKNQYLSTNQNLLRELKQYKQKFYAEKQRANILEGEGKKRQKQFEASRIKLQQAYDKMVKALSNIL